jgi:hypothetical protein
MRIAARARLPLTTILLAVACAAPATAAAAQKTTTCANLQSTLDGAADGDVITITEATCNLTAPLTLPATHPAPFALEVRGSGTGTTLVGTGLAGRILTGDVTAPNVLDLTLRNLVFRDGTSPTTEGGGALRLTGNVGVTLDNDRFLHNASGTNQPGGAALIRSTRGGTTVVRNSVFGDGSLAGSNTAGGRGGGLAVENDGTSIEVTGSYFDRNSAGFTGGGLELVAGLAGTTATLDSDVIRDNTAVFGGGGADITGRAVTLRRNAFHTNSVAPATAQSVAGGGLAVSTAGVLGGSLTQFDNRFDGNSISQGTGPNSGAMGGGESIGGFLHIESLDDRYTSNSLPAPLGTGEAEGAGLAMEGCEALPDDVAQLRAQNLAVAGNSAAGTVDGAGVYVGCDAVPTALTLLDSTVSGNTAGAPGSVGGVAGDGDDKLTVRNSIVTRNPGGLDVSGFASQTVTSSDACAPNGTSALAGAGNICAAPRLVASGPGQGNVHQTAASPTLDRGSNATVPPALKLDYERQGRRLGPAVDMGADELRDTVRPKILSLAAKPTAFVAGSASTTLSFRLSERARMAFAVAQVKGGRRVKGRCVKPTKANRNKPKCKRFVGQGGFSVQAAAGPGSTAFDGRVGKNHRKLAPGTYRISAVAIDSQGNRSTTRSTTVRIAKP